MTKRSAQHLIMNKFFLLLITIGLPCLAYQTEAEPVESPQRMITLYDLTHATDGEPLIASDILQILNKLREHYSNKVDGLAHESELGIVNSLIEASKVSKEKCNVEELTKLREQIKSFNGSKFYLLSYLKHYWHDQFVLCKNWLISIIKKNFETLSEEDRKSVALLRDGMFHRKGPKSGDNGENQGLDLSAPSLEFGLSKIMKLNSKYIMSEYLYHYNGKTYFSQEFLRLIGRPCLRVAGKFKDCEQAFGLFTPDLKIMDEMESFASQWFENVEMCHKILDNVELLSTSVFNKFKSTYGSKDDQMNQIIGAMVPKILSNDIESTANKGIPYVEAPKPIEKGPSRLRKTVQPEKRKHWYELEWGDIP